MIPRRSCKRRVAAGSEEQWRAQRRQSSSWYGRDVTMPANKALVDAPD
jgi:hypothetical protein